MSNVRDENHMEKLVLSCIEAIINAVLFFSLSYLAISRLFGFRFSNFKSLCLLMLSALCIGIFQWILPTGSQFSSTGIFSGIIAPFIISIIIVFAARR